MRVYRGLRGLDALSALSPCLCFCWSEYRPYVPVYPCDNSSAKQAKRSSNSAQSHHTILFCGQYIGQRSTLRDQNVWKSVFACIDQSLIQLYVCTASETRSDRVSNELDLACDLEDQSHEDSTANQAKVTKLSAWLDLSRTNCRCGFLGRISED